MFWFAKGIEEIKPLGHKQSFLQRMHTISKHSGISYDEKRQSLLREISNDKDRLSMKMPDIGELI